MANLLIQTGKEKESKIGKEKGKATVTQDGTTHTTASRKENSHGKGKAKEKAKEKVREKVKAKTPTYVPTYAPTS